MCRFVTILIWMLCGSVALIPESPRPIFGVRVALQATSELTTFVCYLDEGYAYTHKRIVSRADFIKIVSGYWPSIYNPKQIDYFKEKNIGCGMYTDSSGYSKQLICDPFDSLWKIRFSTFPYRSSMEMGWSNKLSNPSEKQVLFLYRNYNVKSVDENFFLDTNFWKLLSDVQDPIWIANYKSLK